MLLVIYFDAFYKDIIQQLNKNNVPHIKLKYATIKSQAHFANILSTHGITQAIISGSHQRILRLPQNLIYLDALVANTSITRIIGICFGWQYLAKISGGTLAEGSLYRGVKKTLFNMPLWFYHHDIVTKMPASWHIFDTATSIDGHTFINAAASKNNRLIGFQFHPEKDSKTFAVFILPLLYGTVN